MKKNKAEAELNKLADLINIMLGRPGKLKDTSDKYLIGHAYIIKERVKKRSRYTLVESTTECGKTAPLFDSESRQPHIIADKMRVYLKGINDHRRSLRDKAQQ